MCGASRAQEEKKPHPKPRRQRMGRESVGDKVRATASWTPRLLAPGQASSGHGPGGDGACTGPPGVAASGEGMYIWKGSGPRPESGFLWRGSRLGRAFWPGFPVVPLFPGLCCARAEGERPDPKGTQGPAVPRPPGTGPDEGPPRSQPKSAGMSHYFSVTEHTCVNRRPAPRS